jgi:hypothetical protein
MDELSTPHRRLRTGVLGRWAYYLDDMRAYTVELSRYLRGDGDRPSLLPPAPQRVTRRYWERRRGGRFG